MTKEQFFEALAQLGFNVSTGHRLIGLGRRTMYRIANGQSAVPETAARLVDMYRLFGVPEAHRP